MPVKTIQSKILPGFMIKAEILKCFTEECVPKWNADDALELWREYKKKVRKLDKRPALAPDLIPLTPEERAIADQVLTEARVSHGNNVLDVVKVDARKLVAFQPNVNLTHSETYGHMAELPDVERLKLALKVGWQAMPIQSMMREDGRYIWLDLPHSEFTPAVDFAKKQISPGESRGMVAVAKLRKRMLLWNGYHRTFSLLSHNNPALNERYVFAVSVSDADQALGALPAALVPKRNVVLGDRPALLTDFFNDDLCMTVTLRKWKAQIRIDKWTNTVARLLVDDEA